ncbi:MAG: ArsI/CadI family heavy metal resistance metalloenzyme [Lysobacter sp.]
MTASTQKNRFHVHIQVSDLDRNVGFYSQLFGVAPSVQKDDYAKWMLDDPQLNFAISSGKSGEIGIAHLGLQAGDAEALAAIGSRLRYADAIALAEAGTTCCYAQSDKFWAEDPQGVRWETFHTHGDATAYYADPIGTPVERDRCCGPDASAAQSPSSGCKTACSVPPSMQATSPSTSACCG